MTVAVARHRTALSRNALSRPLAQALADEIALPERDRIFDYGCGRGDDLRHLGALGFRCSGWDPNHRPNGHRLAADVVNLGYVVNVIEDRTERGEVLRQAWSLATSVLVVSARLHWDAKDLAGRPLGDGILTRTGTFQKFFDHTELAAWIEQVLGTAPLAAAPGIFYLFRRPSDAQAFLARRVVSYRPRVAIDPGLLVEAHREVLEPLIEFALTHGRAPKAGELNPEVEGTLSERMGSTVRAFNLIRRVTSDEQWRAAIEARQRELLVYMALSRFGRRPRFSELSPTMAADIKSLFGSYQAACVRADHLLYATGQDEIVRAVARRSAVGKQTPSTLYVHRSGLDSLPAVLRVYEGCGQVLAGTVAEANLIKLSLSEPQVSYLAYPGFDRLAHPPLHQAIIVNLRRLTVDFRDYSSSANPPILHRKEEFLPVGDPRRDLYARLTRAEERAGLYRHPDLIGSAAGWSKALADCGVTIRGHRLKAGSESRPREAKPQP